MDGDQPVHAVPVEVLHASLCLRDEEADASEDSVADGSLTELS